jgi:hypothetical protein
VVSATDAPEGLEGVLARRPPPGGWRLAAGGWRLAAGGYTSTVARTPADARIYESDCLTSGIGYGHRAARHRCMSRNEVEDVRMTRPATIPGPERQMGRSALLLSLPTACPACGSPSSAGCTRERRVGVRALETEQNDAPERRPSPSLPRRRTAPRERSRSASTLSVRAAWGTPSSGVWGHLCLVGRTESVISLARSHFSPRRHHRYVH